MRARLLINSYYCICTISRRLVEVFTRPTANWSFVSLEIIISALLQWLICPCRPSKICYIRFSFSSSVKERKTGMSNFHVVFETRGACRVREYDFAIFAYPWLHYFTVAVTFNMRKTGACVFYWCHVVL